VRLLFLAGDYPPAFGGIQKLVHGLCLALIEAGHEVRVVAAAQTGDRELDAASGIPTDRCPTPSRLRAAWNMGQAVRRALRGGWTPDAVIATKWSPEGHAYLLARTGRRVPMVLMGYGREFLPERHRRLRGLAQRAVLRAACGAIVCSRFTASQMRAAGVADRCIRVVYPGIDPAEFAPPTDLAEARQRLAWPDGPTILTVGRLVRRKGVDTVIEALPRIAAVVPDVSYVVIGGGPEEERLRRQTEELHVGATVRMLGSASDADKVAALHLCSVFAMPSRDLPAEPPEGFGIVYQEANLCGKPVIGANTGGVAEAIEDGVSGLVIEPDAPHQFADAAITLLSDPGLASSLGEAGRRRAIDRFSWPVIGPQYAAAVGELSGSHS